MDSAGVGRLASHVPYQRHRPSPTQLNPTPTLTFLYLHLTFSPARQPKCPKQKPAQQKPSQTQADGKASADSGKSARSDPVHYVRSADWMQCEANANIWLLVVCRWYCQACEKQCPDENGFKCHVQSESHVRCMMLIGEDSKSHIENYSREFSKNFVDTLRTTHGTKSIHANHFYQG